MRVFLIPLFSHVRGSVRRAPSSRFYVVPALAWTNATISHSKQVKEGNFDGKALELNETGVLRVLNSMKDDPYLAFSFLRRIEGNGALPSVQAYATVIRIVCSWSLDEKFDRFFVGLISKGDEGRGFSVVDLLNAIGVAEEDRKLSFLLLSRVSNALVKAYANLKMFDEAIRLFWGIEQLGWDADAHTYVLVVQVLQRNRDNEGVEKFLRKLLSSETRKPCVFYMDFIGGLCVHQMALIAYLLLQPLRDAQILVDNSDLAIAYHKVVRGLCNEMKLQDAESALLDMEKCGIDPDVCVYSAILEGHRKNMNFNKALDFFDSMLQKENRINCVIVSSILQGYCQMGKFLKAYDLFIKCLRMGISLDRVCYNVAFDALIKLGKVEEAIELFREMTDKEIAPDVVNYTTLIGGCCLQGRCDQALDLIIEMEKTGKTPDIVTYNVLASGLARNGLSEKAFGTLKIMEARGVKPTSITHNMVIQGLIVAGKIDEAEAFYESLEEHKSAENEAGMVKGYCEAGRLDKAFERFIRVDFPLPKNVYFTLFSSLCAKDDHISKAQSLLKRMWNLGVEPGMSMYGKLIGAWCRVYDVRKAQQFLKVLEAREIILDLFTYTIMIKTCCRLNKLKQADALFRDMKRRGIKPDVVTYTVLVKNNPKFDRKSEMEAFDVKPDVFYYTTMINTYYRLNNQKKANALFQEMKRGGIVPDVVTYTVLLNHKPESDMKREMKALGIKRDVHYYTVLIDWQCKIGELEEAERIFEEMIESGVEPDVVFYTALIAGCCRNGSVHKAVKVMQEMWEKGIEPTEASKSLVEYTIFKAKRHRSRQRSKNL